jgi:hypothetical protein
MLLGGCEGAEDDGGAEGPALVDGQVDGKPLRIRSAIVTRFAGDEPDSLSIILTDAPDACAALRTERRPRGGHVLEFWLRSSAEKGWPAGRYRSTTGAGGESDPRAVVSLLTFDAGCRMSVPPRHAVGDPSAVTLDQDLGVIGDASGQFEVVFSNSDRLVGRYQATYCDARPRNKVFNPRLDVPCAN